MPSHVDEPTKYSDIFPDRRHPYNGVLAAIRRGPDGQLAGFQRLQLRLYY